MTGVVTARFGVFSGELLLKEILSGNRKTLILAAGASSFFSLAILHWIVDVKKWRSWMFFFRVKGDGITANFRKWSGGELRSRENANQMAIAVEVQGYSFARLTKYTAPTMQRNAHR